MNSLRINRREFLDRSGKLLLGAAAASLAAGETTCIPKGEKAVVSIVRIRNGNIGAAVEEAVDLLGGIGGIAKGKERIMLKPNLVSPSPQWTSKPAVVKALAGMMKRAGKDVSIGEGSAASPPWNVRGNEIFRTTKRDLLDKIQQFTFDSLGYTEMAKSLGVPLVNLHTGEMVDVKLPSAFVFPTLTIHRSLAETDLLCSVPMMKTHTLAQVTLGMKNLVGVYPGTVYQAVRGRMHDIASAVEPSGTAVAVVDMVRVNKLGLVVVDASTAMEGQGPTGGTLVQMGLIIAGTNPLATDMVAAHCMGFEPHEIPTFTWAQKAGLKPGQLEDIEIRGEAPDKVARKFARPTIYAWRDIRQSWGARET